MHLRACTLNVFERAALALICCIPACAWAAAGAETPVPVAQVIAAQRLPPSTVSFVILDPDTGRVVRSQNPDTPRSPASTIKVLTTFAALELLGPSYTWHTRASIRGALNDGVLDGDLILQGGGDPYMTLERWWSFARALRATGLKRIDGDILVDDTAFPCPGGPRRIRRTAESRIQRRAGCVDGEFPIGRIHGRARRRRPARRRSRESGPRQSRNRKSRALRGRPLQGCGRQSRFQGGFCKLGQGVFGGALSPHCADAALPGAAAAGHVCLRHFRRIVAGIGRRVHRQAAHRGGARGCANASQLRLLELGRNRALDQQIQQ